MIGHEIFGVLLAIVGGAIFIAALSPKATTGQVIKASGDTFGNLISSMTAPVTGG